MATQSELDKLGPLSIVGKEIDVTPETFGFMRSSSDIIEDAEALHDRMSQDGYLYLPGLLDAELALSARREIVHRMDARGVFDPNYPKMDAVAKSSDPVWMGTKDLMPGNQPLQDLLYDGRMIQFYEHYLGGEVLHYTFTWFRTVPPTHSSPPHCDLVFMGRGTFDLFTSWTPLGDVPIENGPLVLLEGSNNKSEQIQDYLHRDVDTYCENKPNAEEIRDGKKLSEVSGVLSQDAREVQRLLGGRWVTTNFKLGDVVVFTMGTVHGSLDNKSDRIRLSTDTRYQLASEPADERWIGENPSGHGPKAMRALVC